MSHFIHSCFRINFAGGIEATRISGHCHEAWTRLGLVASRLWIHCQRASVGAKLHGWVPQLAETPRKGQL